MGCVISGYGQGPSSRGTCGHVTAWLMSRVTRMSRGRYIDHDYNHHISPASGCGCGWLRPTVAIFSLLFSPAVLCLYCKQLYFYIFFLCFGVIFYYFDPCKFWWLSNKFCSGKNHHQHHVYLQLNINADAHLHSRDWYYMQCFYGQGEGLWYEARPCCPVLSGGRALLCCKSINLPSLQFEVSCSSSRGGGCCEQSGGRLVPGPGGRGWVMTSCSI